MICSVVAGFCSSELFFKSYHCHKKTMINTNANNIAIKTSRLMVSFVSFICCCISGYLMHKVPCSNTNFQYIRRDNSVTVGVTKT
jgi:predicted RND superfamily exporter protein